VQTLKTVGSVVFVLGLCAGVAYLVYLFLAKAWTNFVSLDEDIAIAALTAGTTVIVATLTVTLGRYFERKKDIEAQHRSKKIEIYDEFLLEFFKVMGLGSESAAEEEVLAFLRE